MLANAGIHACGRTRPNPTRRVARMTPRPAEFPGKARNCHKTTASSQDPRDTVIPAQAGIHACGRTRPAPTRRVVRMTPRLNLNYVVRMAPRLAARRCMTGPPPIL